MNPNRAPGPRPLVVRLRNFVGDVILGLPALRLLREHGHTLHLIGKPWAAGLLAAEGWSVETLPRGHRDRVRQLRPFKGADAVVFPFSFSSALEMRLAGLNAIGYRHEARGWLLHRSLPMLQGRHELERYWHLAGAYLGVEQPPPSRIGLLTTAGDQQAADALLASRGLAPGGFVLACPFAGGTMEKMDKHWPHFQPLVTALLDRGWPVLVCPGPGEAGEVEGWDERLVVMPDVRLGPLGGLSRRAALVISNDTGPGHLAAAVDAPLISVLGPTPPAQWAPWGPQVGIVRRWPGWPGVDEVLAASMDRLAGLPAPATAALR